MKPFYIAKPQTVPSYQKNKKPNTFAIKLKTRNPEITGVTKINDSVVQISSKRIPLNT